MIPDAVAAVVERYGRFARDEAPGRSRLYEDWASGVAAGGAAAAVLARIPETHRQPPLVFAVARLLGAPEAGFAAWEAWLAVHADELVAEASRRRLQTNEPQRCAALLPALATVPGPVALLELGASAGLCLYPDRYSYRYRRARVADARGRVVPDADAGGDVDLDPAAGPSSVVLTCTLTGMPGLRLPEIVWRAGIDLDPLDARDDADRRFLSTLVWPGEQGRAERIAAALDIAAADPPLLVAGDASDPDVLFQAASRAPRGATLVITTPGVLPHIPRAGRERLLATLAELDAVWISIDPPKLRLAWDPPVDERTWGGFVLGRDGVPLAAVDPLGASVEWRAGARAFAG